MTEKVLMKMIEYFANDPKRIQHFMKVYGFVSLIGTQENLDLKELETLKITAIVHDIGIKPAEEKYGNCNGKLQEQEGPNAAKELLSELFLEKTVIDRVSYLISHHHTYTDIKELDYQILVEADFLVNLYEDNIEKDNISITYKKIFRTETGKKICRDMFGLE